MTKHITQHQPLPTNRKPACIPISAKSFLEQVQPNSLTLLSFNIQVGIQTSRFHHYLTKSWQHIMPTPGRQRALEDIAKLSSDFDLVGIQEADGGSWRSGFINQVRYLADQGGHGHWYQQQNRNLGAIAQHSNGFISRYRPSLIEDHPLPGYIPGRGAIVVNLGEGEEAILVVMLHLSLGKGTQNKQLEYVRSLIGNHRNVVIMGDLNTEASAVTQHPALLDLSFNSVDPDLHTYPSWKPTKALDHILVSETLSVRQTAVLETAISDHLPMAIEIEVPKGLVLEAPEER